MRFIFPFYEINKNSRIVLYGASEEGYDFYRQIISTDYCTIVNWVDKQYEWCRILNLPVNPPESIVEVEYDYIILTAEKEIIAQSMINDLCGMGVDGNKIVWKTDCLIKGNIAAKYDPIRIQKESLEAIENIPTNYLKDNMLDIVVRYMYAKDILLNRDVSQHREMYRKLMMVQNDGKEPTDDMIHAYFTEYSMKKGWKAFDESFVNLVKSMKQNGFKREYFIPIDNKEELINGRHRMAVALALNLPIWIRQYPCNGLKLCFDREWFQNNNFSTEEINEIIENYYLLKKDKEYNN